MYLKNHGIPTSSVDRAFQISEEFFNTTPLEVKNTFPRDIDGTNIGYTGENSERLDVAKQYQGDFKETFNMSKFADETYQQRLPPVLSSHWEEIQQFQKQCHIVTLKVLTLFALALDLPQDYFAKQHNAVDDTLRFLCYSPSPKREKVHESDIGAGAHTDFGSITLLFQDNVGGLQVQSPNSWIDATPITDTILVNVADAMQFWTSQSLKSTTHRVQIPVKQRFSIAYFVQADPDTPLKPIHSAQEDAPVITARQHLFKQIHTAMGRIPVA